MFRQGKDRAIDVDTDRDKRKHKTRQFKTPKDKARQDKTRLDEATEENKHNAAERQDNPIQHDTTSKKRYKTRQEKKTI